MTVCSFCEHFAKLDGRVSTPPRTFLFLKDDEGKYESGAGTGKEPGDPLTVELKGEEEERQGAHPSLQI